MAKLLTLRRSAEATITPSTWPDSNRHNVASIVLEADPLLPALTFVDAVGVIERWSFDDLAREAGRWAEMLRARGLGPGDRVFVFVGRTPAWPAVLLGTLKAGLVAIPCPETLQAPDLGIRLSGSNPRIVVTDRARAPLVGALDLPVDFVVMEDAAAELASHPFDGPTHETGSNDTAFVLYAADSTIAPREPTHFQASALAKRLRAESWLDAQPGDLVWCTTGAGSASSIWTGLLGPWVEGIEVVLHDGVFDPEQRVELIRRLGVTILSQPAVEYRRMLEIQNDGSGLGRLRRAVATGDRLGQATVDAFREVFGIEVYDGYSAAEIITPAGPDNEPATHGRETEALGAAAEGRRADVEGHREEEKAAAELAQRREAEARREADATAKAAELKRKLEEEEEERRREEEKAAAELAQRLEAEARREADATAKAAEKARRVAGRLSRSEPERMPGRDPREQAAENPGADDSTHPELVARIRAYGASRPT